MPDGKMALPVALIGCLSMSELCLEDPDGSVSTWLGDICKVVTRCQVLLAEHELSHFVSAHKSSFRVKLTEIGGSAAVKTSLARFGWS